MSKNPFRRAPGQDLLLTPEDAQGRFEDLYGDYDEEMVQMIKEGMRSSRVGSHETRAILRIAEGTEPRILADVYMELRREDGLPDVR